MLYYNKLGLKNKQNFVNLKSSVSPYGDIMANFMYEFH